MRTTPDVPARYSDALAVRPFRGLLLAHTLSSVGDQLTRVALASLVFERSGDAALTALVYAATYLPWIVGATLLSDLADRFSRRDVLLGCDLSRAVLVASMAVPGIPLWLVGALALLSAVLEPPFESARAALLPDVLEGDRYVVGQALVTTTGQGAQVLGFAAGGLLVAALGTSGTLLVDAATFCGSALVVRLTLPRPARATTGRLGLSVGRAPRYVLGDPALRSLVLLACASAAAAIATEGLAVPLADSRGGGPATRGVLLAAMPAGAVLGAVLLARLVRPSRRLALMRPLALWSVVLLCLTPVVPGVWGIAVLWFLAGLGTAFHLPANAAFVRAARADMRGRAFAVANGGLMLAQGCGILAAAVLTLVAGPEGAVALAAAAGAAVVLLVPLASVRALPAPG